MCNPQRRRLLEWGEDRTGGSSGDYLGSGFYDVCIDLSGKVVSELVLVLKNSKEVERSDLVD